MVKKDILAHFQAVDPILYSLVEKVTLPPISKRKPEQYFHHLCHEIIGQQLSGKVADVICARFDRLFPKGRATPQTVLKTSGETLRKTGMAWSKTRSIRDLAQKVAAKLVSLAKLDKLSNAEVIAELTKVKGIGPWTAEMFLMFTLGREDVFSFGDLGLKKAIMKLYNLKHEPSQKKLAQLSNKWSPYRTHAALVLWKSLDG